MWHHQQNDIAWHASKLQIRLKFRHRREAEAKKQSPTPPHARKPSNFPGGIKQSAKTWRTARLIFLRLKKSLVKCLIMLISNDL